MLKNSFSLEGETALITGGGTGLGLGMARCMVEAGAKVVLVGRTESTLEAAAQELGPQASFLAHDLTELNRAAELVPKVQHCVNAPISILVNNAGIHLKKTAQETNPADFERVLKTHVMAAQALTQAALPGMLDRQHGHILFTSSMAGLFGIPYVMAYAAAKTALIGMMRSLATEVSSRGVRVNAIAPGWIESRMLRQALDGDDARTRKILDRTPMRRFGTPEDIGWAAVYLSAPAARFITGVTLPVDGGASMGF